MKNRLLFLILSMFLLGACAPSPSSEQNPSESGKSDAGNKEEPKESSPEKEVDCKEGDERDCYTGTDGTKDVGPCKSGKQVCVYGKWSKCFGQVLPHQETCDNIDNDCDGKVNEGLKGCNECTKDGDCPTDKPSCKNKRCVKPCKTNPDCGNTGFCSQGICNACASGTSKTKKEVCNGIDDDCDGTIDEDTAEDCYSGDAKNKDKGICKTGKYLCIDGKLWKDRCAGEVLPQQERCNGKDDNCDGYVDNDVDAECFTGADKYIGKGKCKAGRALCKNGVLDKTQCTGEVLPSKEVCNGVDDDCNGMVDDKPVDAECFSGYPGHRGRGACSIGYYACTNGKLDKTKCVGEGKSTKEVCNGKDDDCDGVIDNGVSVECYTGKADEKGKGICKAGEYKCVAGKVDKTVCVGEVLAAQETCNGKDDDCDGMLDEATGASCYTGDKTLLGKGTCKQGTYACINGQIDKTKCVEEVRPAAETCNGKDDDCDGTTDEDADTPCFTGNAVNDGVGACKKGVYKCVGGKPDKTTCIGEVKPSKEVCDGKDNDCNGIIDEKAHEECYTGDTTKIGIGTCRKGLHLCLDGKLDKTSCVSEITVDQEVCDGKDNDCNGKVDDLPLQDKGICQYDKDRLGLYSCKAGKLTCTASFRKIINIPVYSRSGLRHEILQISKDRKYAIVLNSYAILKINLETQNTVWALEGKFFPRFGFIDETKNRLFVIQIESKNNATWPKETFYEIDYTTGKLVEQNNKVPASVAAYLTPDRKKLYLLHFKTRELAVYDTDTWKEISKQDVTPAFKMIRDYQYGNQEVLRMSNDEKLMAFSERNGPIVYFRLGAAKAYKVSTFYGLTRHNSYTFSHDNKHIIHLNDYRLRYYDVDTGKRDDTLDIVLAGDKDKAQGKFSYDGKMLWYTITTKDPSPSKGIYTYDLVNRVELFKGKPLVSAKTTAGFGTRGNNLYFKSTLAVFYHQGENTTSWDLVNRKELDLFKRSFATSSVGTLPDGKTVFTVNFGRVTYWDPRKKDPFVGRITGPSGMKSYTEHNTVHSKDGYWTLHMTDTLQVQLFDHKNKKLDSSAQLAGKERSVNVFRATSDLKHLVYIQDKHLKVYDWDAKKEKFSLDMKVTEISYSVYHLAVSPDNTKAVVTISAWSDTAPRTIQVYDITTGTLIKEFKDSTTKNITAIVVLRDNKTVVTVGSDRVLRFWEMTTGKELYQLFGHLDDIKYMFVSNDGNRLIVAEKKYLRIWNIAKRKLIASYPFPNGIDKMWYSPFGPTYVIDTTSRYDHNVSRYSKRVLLQFE